MPCFGFGLECPFVGKPHAVDFDGEFCTLCNFLGGFQKFLRRVASAHFANASLGFEVEPNLVGIPIALAFVLHFVDVDADVAILLEPREMVRPSEISERTLQMMDESIRNLHAGKVSAPIDLSGF